jgi:4-hydroxybenzoate polyprenyltransferase
MLKSLIKTVRPKQWYKNFVIFIAIVFSGNLQNLTAWFDSIIAFSVFCLIAGSVYIINDIVDVDKDRQHPIKKDRPIASGKLKKSHALVYAMVLLSASLLIAVSLNNSLALVAYPTL